MIRLLPPEARASLRSGIAIPSIAQCVEELVLNSVDAEATCIAVRVDIPNGKIQVVDNGKGLTRDNFDLVGQYYATSKCHSVAALDNLKHFGYRGEALASISHMSRVLEIVSRAKDSDVTRTKMFRDGKAEVFEASVKRPSVGTTITAHGLFYNMPVRRKMISPSLDYERVCQRMEGVTLIHPGVSFSLRDDSTGLKSIQTRITPSVVNTFRFLFGQAKMRSLKEVNHEHRQFNISGYIGVEGHPNKNLQFVYVNNRLILKSRLQKVVNYLLRKSSIAHAKPRYGEKDNTTDSTNMSVADFSSSPGKASDHYGIFVLNIKCPLSDYDICFEPSKTLVEFREWNEVLRCMEQLVKQFLIPENLSDKVDKESQTRSPDAKSGIFMLDDGSSQEDEDAIVEEETTKKGPGMTLSEKYGRRITALSCSSTLQSLTVRRSQCRASSKPSTTPPKVSWTSKKQVIQKTNSASCISCARKSVDGTANETLDASDEPMDSDHHTHNKEFPTNDKELNACIHHSANRCGRLVEEHASVEQTMPQSPDRNCNSVSTKSQGPDFQSSADFSILPSELIEHRQLSLHVDNAETLHKEFVTLCPMECAKNPNVQQAPCQLKEESKKMNEPLVEKHLKLPTEHKTRCLAALDKHISDSQHGSTDVEGNAVVAHSTDCKTNDSPEFRPDEKTTAAQDVHNPCVVQQKQTDTSSATNKSRPNKQHLKICLEINSRSSSTDKIIQNYEECQKQVATPELRSTDTLRKMDGITASPAINLGTSSFDADSERKASSLFPASDKNEHHSESTAAITPSASRNKPLIASDKGQDKNIDVQARHSFISLKPHNSSSSKSPETHRHLSGLLSSLQIFKNSLQRATAQIKSTKHSTSKVDSRKNKEATSRFFTPDNSLKRHPSCVTASPPIRLKKRNLGGLKIVAHKGTDEKLAQVEVPPHGPVSPVTRGRNVASERAAPENSKLKDEVARDKPLLETRPTCDQVKSSKNVDDLSRTCPVIKTDKRSDLSVKPHVTFLGQQCKLPDRSTQYKEGNDSDNYSSLPKPNLKRLASKSFSIDPHNAYSMMPQSRNRYNIELGDMEATLPKRFITSRSFLQSVQEVLAPDVISRNLKSQPPNRLQPVYFFPKDAVCLCTVKRSSAKQDENVEPNVLSSETTKSVERERHNLPPQNTEVHNYLESCTFRSQEKKCFTNTDDSLSVFAEEPETSGAILKEKTAVDSIVTANCLQTESDELSSENELRNTHSKIQEILSSSSLSVLTNPRCTPSTRIGEVRFVSLNTDSDSQSEVHTIHDESSANDVKASSTFPEIVSLGETTDSDTDDLPAVDIGTMPSECSKLDRNICEAPAGIDKVTSEACGVDRSVAQDSIWSEVGTRSPDKTNAKQPDTQQHVLSHCTSSSNMPNQVYVGDKSASPLKDEKSEHEPTDTCVVNKEKLIPSELNDDNSEHVSEVENVITDISGKHWSCHYDTKMEQQVYIDLSTGNCSLEAPTVGGDGQADDKGAGEEATRARSGPSAVIVSTGRKKSHLHRVHSLCAQPFLTTSQRPGDLPATEPKGTTDLSPSSHSALIDMVEEHIDHQDCQIASKWRGESPSKLVTDDKSWMDKLFDNWTNPMFASLESDIIDAQCNHMPRNAIRAQNTVHPYKFSKALFQDIKVLGQVDNKFIACMVRTDEINHATDPNLLLLIDQHAAHERIRLEQLISDVFEDSTTSSDDGDSTCSTEQPSVKSSNVIPSVELTLSHRTLRLLQSFRDKLEVLGISYRILDSDRGDEMEEGRVEITRLPACLVEREAGELRRGRPTVAASMVEMLLTEHLETLQKTSGANAVLPGTIIKVLNSQACHGAIKFGDQLSHHECLSLIGQLAQCDLPFQCAHGRPSLVPLFDLDLLTRKFDKADECKPRLQRLHHLAR